MFVLQILPLLLITAYIVSQSACSHLELNALNLESTLNAPKNVRNCNFSLITENPHLRYRRIKPRSIGISSRYSYSFDPSSQARSTNVCSLPQQIGNGPYRILRWYYNAARMRCELFYWSGCCANANNFPSIHSCQRSCEVDPCQQNLEQGYGDVSIRRYYFNKSTKTCEQFNYHGNSGNRNNFQSLQECQQQCPEKPNPCAFGSSIPAVPCYGGNTCTVNQFCHIGQFQETTVCCNRSPNGNQCGQVLVPGLGNAHLQRWYFNITSQYCQPFIYKGLQGNENNFLSPSECQSTCFVNPCALGEPYRSQNDIVHCSSKSSTSCPSGYFCHFGAMLQTTVCCPKLGGNACEQPVDRGEGSYQLQRWYWNGASQRCIHFVYGGLKGTQNNFLSEESCEKTCYVSKNPCALGAPQQTSNKRPLSCSSSYNICGPTYWCHIGAEPETTVCCPGRVEGSAICQLPLSVGFGNANLQRWYFNPSTQTCIPFSYGGMFGNQNNFLTYQGCKKVCPGFVNPCVSGDPEVDEHGNIMTCSISFNSCSPAFWCHIGADSKTTVCCPGRVLDICELPVSIGEGSANLQRWYFNTVTQKCNQFNYGGLRGNQNNFITEHQCEQTCPVFVNPCATGSPQMGVNNRPQMCNSQSECNVDFWCHIGSGPESNVCCPGKVSGYAICSQPMVSGTGSASLKRWYYDVNSRQCLPFIYHGLKGNQNNFLSQQQCQLACPAYVNVCPEGDPLINSITNQPQSCTFEEMNCGPNYWCHLGLVPSEYQCCPGKETKLEVCQLPKSLGVLGAAEPPATRWYYEPATMACKTFQYNGRKGNQNNFLTKADCEATCPVFINPCNRPIALPAQSCSPSQECTSGSYCHYGLTPETTICCPLDQGNRCELPKVVGTGNGSLQRWFYNPQKGICEIFIYRGLHGNANNYLSKESCEMACQINPCANGREDSPFTYIFFNIFGQPLTNLNGTYQICEVTTQMHSCPSGYWCNPGVSPLTTVCCPGAVSDPCNLPVITGEGTDQLERYYYDRISQTCKMFTYGGMKGNQNNFLSKEACQLRCHPLDNPCIGQPASTATGQVLFCSSTNKEMCPVNFWCHIGATPQTTVCCPGATNPCSVPLSPGTGNAGLSRWYYNPDDRECLPFQYNGKRGNQNNFESQADCARTCPEGRDSLSVFENVCIGRVARDKKGNPRTCNPLKVNPCRAGYFCLTGNRKNPESYCCASRADNVCAVHMSEGEGQDELQRWYFNSEKKICSPFVYRGRKGNENNFVTKELCEQSCQPGEYKCWDGKEPLHLNGQIVRCENVTCPQNYYCHIGHSTRSTFCCKRQGYACLQRKLSGIGDESHLRWYYDLPSDTCRKFHFTGVGGNENNFLSKSDCENACIGKEDVCTTGRPLMSRGKVVHCSLFERCPEGYTCQPAIGHTLALTVCCSSHTVDMLTTHQRPSTLLPANLLTQRRPITPSVSNATQYRPNSYPTATATYRRPNILPIDSLTHQRPNSLPVSSLIHQRPNSFPIRPSIHQLPNIFPFGSRIYKRPDTSPVDSLIYERPDNYPLTIFGKNPK